MNQESLTQRKKVLFLITKATFGGAQRYVYDLSTNLPQNEFESGVAYGTPGRLSELLETHGTPVLHIPSLQRSIGFLSEIKTYAETRDAISIARPDVLHLNSSKAAAFGALAGWRYGVPTIIFTVHGWPFKESRNIFSKSIIYLISWFTALLSTHVVVVSRTDEVIGKRMPWVAKKIVYIPLGRENLNLASPQEGFKKMFGDLPVPPITDKTLRLVSLAELTRNKGLIYAIESVAILARRGFDCVYVIAGEGEDRETLIRSAHAHGVEDRIYMPGFIADAARYLSGFDAYLLPSLKEGMPYVLIEASLAGLPIIATSVIDQDFADLLENTRIVDPGNALALADGIEALATRSRSTHSSENHFPLSTMVNETLELYRKEVH